MAAPANLDDTELTRISGRLYSQYLGLVSPETVRRFVEESYSSFAQKTDDHSTLASKTEAFAADRLSAMAKNEGIVHSATPEVLFVCVHNSGRSQMAAALLDARSGGRVIVQSAGSDPGSELNPAVVEALREIGLDVRKEFPKPLTDEIARSADVIITMGCGDACPVYLGKRYLDWKLDDPAGKSIEEVRVIRDQILKFTTQLLVELSMTLMPIPKANAS